MDATHSLLKRQLKRHFGEKPNHPAEWQAFIGAINEAYAEFDDDRMMLERSLELSSQELLHANSEMRAVFQVIPDLLVRLAQDGTILDIKAGANSDFMFQRRNFFGKHIRDIPVQPIALEFQKAMDRVVKEKSLITIEYTLQLHGQQCLYEARFVPLFEDQIVVIIRNITERKRAEAAIQERLRLEEQLSKLATTTPGVIHAFRLCPDGTTCFPYANPGIENIYGLKPEDLVADASRAWARIHPDDIPRLKAAIDKSMGHMTIWHEEFRVNHPQKGQLWVEGCSSPVRESDGSMLWHGFLLDISERKQLETQLRQSQKMQAFGQLAAGVAHDFNNILTVIQGNISLLQMGQLTPDEQASASTEIFRAAQRAANLTRQLLTFSRRQPMQSHDLDLNEVVANVTKMLRRLIGEDIALETRFASGGAPVHADPGMLEQVLMNLAVNARDAMPKGGRLNIVTELVTLADTAQSTKQTARPDDFVCLSVTDTGLGVAPEHLPHLFEPFFTTKDVGKGTGLGLATVFGIVEQHQGWIEVESQPNQGTTFHIFLPRLPRKPTNGDPPAAPLQMPGGTESILLVEDEKPLRQLMQRVLERQGYQVHVAASGVQALEIWRERQEDFDILVTDMIMPNGMNGRELADTLRNDKPDLKIIYCSGYANNLPGKDAPLSAHEDYLEKPFEPVKLLQKVRDCVDAK
jgi:PAS domain S-box-containing protein